MALHDSYARRTPFELAFPDSGRAEALASESIEEASARGVDPHHPQMFATLGSVGRFLLELRDAEAPADALHQYAALAFHGVHFVRAGRPLYLIDAAATRRLVVEVPGRIPEPPHGAGYLQLPQHLVWIEAADEQVPESVDGIFWTVTPANTLHALLVTGMRPDRPGVSVVPIPEAPLAEATAWMSAEVRSEGQGADFSSAIPGASLDGLLGLRTAGEPLKLLARFFAHVDSESAQEVDPPSDAGPPGPTPSGLRFRRVGVDG